MAAQMRLRPTMLLLIMLGFTPFLFFQLSPVRASQNPKNIFLPFYTGWEQPPGNPNEPLGTSNCLCNQVYQKSSAMWGSNNGGSGSIPQLSLLNASPPNPINFQGAYGFTPGGKADIWYLNASGYFSGAGAWATLRLFDSSPQSDYQPPFTLQPHTFLSVWYYHLANGLPNNIMIDANLYDSYKNTYSTLGTFLMQTENMLSIRMA